LKDIWAAKEASIRYEGKNMIIKSPYEPNFVNDLKSGTTLHKWAIVKKEWVVDVSERDMTLDIIRRYFLILEENQPSPDLKTEAIPPASSNSEFEIREGDKLEVWADGACAGNPGPGGYGVLFKNHGQIKELAGGFSFTTNNRMEIMAAIVALESLNSRCDVTIYSDSRYLVDTMTLGWAKNWRAKGWKRNNKEKAINSDLWQRLLELCTRHNVKFIWVKGHSVCPENQRCDELAEITTKIPGLPEDKGYNNDFK
jgi:ribonuclease HI